MKSKTNIVKVESLMTGISEPSRFAMRGNRYQGLLNRAMSAGVLSKLDIYKT